jgi:hypothetical protein
MIVSLSRKAKLSNHASSITASNMLSAATDIGIENPKAIALARATPDARPLLPVSIIVRMPLSAD